GMCCYMLHYETNHKEGSVREYKIAHVREQGQQMIIIPLDPDFDRQTPQNQQETVASLQVCASSANLAGTVVVVWQAGNRMKFIAPEQWHPFFRTLPWRNVIANLNKTLTCR